MKLSQESPEAARKVLRIPPFLLISNHLSGIVTFRAKQAYKFAARRVNSMKIGTPDPVCEFETRSRVHRLAQCHAPATETAQERFRSSTRSKTSPVNRAGQLGCLPNLDSPSSSLVTSQNIANPTKTDCIASLAPRFHGTIFDSRQSGSAPPATVAIVH